MPSFTAAAAAAKFAPRSIDADPATFLARVRGCETCPNRAGHSCRLTDRLVSIMARPAVAHCPNGAWPGDLPPSTPAAPPAGSPIAHRSAAFPPCAVAIISHNYGRYLAEAIESVLQQSVRPAEVLVVDDASADDTGQVARDYADAGVSLLRIEAGNVHLARAEAFEATSAPVLLFLDADDALTTDYLARGLPAFADPRVGLVYSDMELFGAETGQRRFGPPAAVRLAQQNQCHAGSLVRRAALEISGAFDPGIVVSRRSQDDWFLWRRVLAAGWTVAKNSALYRYRRHNASQTSELVARQTAYFDLAALDLEEITLFVPLAGRQWAWPRLRDFLERQTWPHHLVRLVLCDTSTDAGFAHQVREWLAACDYGDVRYYRQSVGAAGLADADRRDRAVARRVQAAMPRIYNRLAREATTEYLWIVEDDILPPLNAAERLLRGMHELVASVSGAYRSRFQPGWVAWDRQGRILTEPGLGSVAVGGNGFGCVMLRRSVLSQTVLQHAAPTADYDPNFYAALAATGWQARLDWSIDCQHGEPISRA